MASKRAPSAASRGIAGHPSVLAWPGEIDVIPLPEPETVTERLADARLLIETDAGASSVADALDSVPFEKWEAFVEQTLREQPAQAEKFLRWVAARHSESELRFNAIRILDGLIDEEFRRELLEREQDAETQKLLLDLGRREAGARGGDQTE
jgi:hypothetical protein